MNKRWAVDIFSNTNYTVRDDEYCSKSIPMVHGGPVRVLAGAIFL